MTRRLSTKDWPSLVDLTEVFPHVQARWAMRHGLRAAEELVGAWRRADRRDAELMLWIGTRRQLRTVYVDGEPFEAWLLPGFEDSRRVRRAFSGGDPRSVLHR